MVAVQIRPSRLFAARPRGQAAPVERRALDTIYLLLGIIGFFIIIAIFFFGGFVLLDFLWGRRGGDA